MLANLWVKLPAYFGNWWIKLNHIYFFLIYEPTWRIDGLLIDCVQVYSGLYVNEAADLEDEDFESLDDPAVVRYQDRSAYIYMSEILKKITKYLSQAACSNIFFFSI